jgi:DNA-binding NtrC family response regulator
MRSRNVGEVTLEESSLLPSGADGPRMFLLKVAAGASVGTEVAIGARPIVVGAGSECDLVLEDAKVSKRHLELRCVPGGLRVLDLGSRNGTFVDGVRISDAVLARSASIRCGATVLRTRYANAPAIRPSSRRRFGALIGESIELREVFAVLERASRTNATILLEGESGTGKELAARAIHDHSPRAEGQFVVVDCSATSPGLIESHLFGHKRGAFTGALDDRRGAFVEAHKGTLFLDELGELPAELQSKLLRVLETRTVQAVGSDTSVEVDVRIIAATNRDLHAMVQQGTFRMDLLHRLAVVQVVIPPLRERLDDLPGLIRGFYEGRGLDPGPIDGPNLDRLHSYHWPGNARELRHVIERAWIFGEPVPFRELTLWLGPTERAQADVIDVNLSFKEAKEHWVATFERRYLASVFAMYEGNVTRAAAHAGINRNHFAKLLDEHGLRER